MQASVAATCPLERRRFVSRQLVLAVLLSAGVPRGRLGFRKFMMAFFFWGGGDLCRYRCLRSVDSPPLHPHPTPTNPPPHDPGLPQWQVQAVKGPSFVRAQERSRAWRVSCAVLAEWIVSLLSCSSTVAFFPDAVERALSGVLTQVAWHW